MNGRFAFHADIGGDGMCQQLLPFSFMLHALALPCYTLLWFALLCSPGLVGDVLVLPSLSHRSVITITINSSSSSCSTARWQQHVLHHVSGCS
jgi:hypothetical protein